ncbi:MAG: hypothetical protein H0W12_03795 [Chitinophagaceae bacterium]|nr:hypothetical protein [Chitinophagaceae bacterium]
MTNKNNETEYPGYPHYPAKEDIMNQKNIQKVDVDVENMSRATTVVTKLQHVKQPDENIMTTTEVDITEESNDADITDDDLIALGTLETDTAKVDLLEGEDDLDVPGAEEDDADEEIGEEDEENNYYSLGGDAHENLEEDQA